MVSVTTLVGVSVVENVSVLWSKALVEYTMAITTEVIVDGASVVVLIGVEVVVSVA